MTKEQWEMTYNELCGFLVYCQQFNDNRSNISTKQLVETLDDFYKKLCHFKKELMIITYSKSNYRDAQPFVNDINDEIFSEIIDALQSMNYTEDFCSQTNAQIIDDYVKRCLSTLKSIIPTFAKLKDSNFHKDFFDFHKDYSYHCNISEQEFDGIYRQYLDLGCYSADTRTLTNLKYFILGGEHPLQLEAVMWLGPLSLLGKFMRDMQCNNSKIRNWNEHAGKIFLIANRQKEKVFVNPDTLKNEYSRVYLAINN